MSSLNVRWLSALTIVAAAVLGASQSFAATTSGTLSVTATVASVCLISNGTLAFGTYDPSSGTPHDGSTTLTLTCTVGTAYKIGMAAGGGSGATVALRKLTNGGSTLNYRLFQDSSHTVNWGNTVGVDTLDATTTTLTSTINVYGQIPNSQASPAGAYTDTVAITVTY